MTVQPQRPEPALGGGSHDDFTPLEDVLLEARNAEAIHRLEAREVPAREIPRAMPFDPDDARPLMAMPTLSEPPPGWSREFVPVELFRARRGIPLGVPLRWHLLIADMENYRRETGDRLAEVWSLVDAGQLDAAEARFDARVQGRG